MVSQELHTPTTADLITAIVPARNEEAVIAACIKALCCQPEVAEILVVNDQSTDRTAEIVRALIPQIPKLRLLETHEVPPGWVGKNHAVSLAAQYAKHTWLLFTDADAELENGATATALQIFQDSGPALISFSPEQVTRTWYEKSLIPFVYCRLAKRFSFEKVNDPACRDAAANGQFMMIHRQAYQAVGGHASVAAEVLEDVAIARRIKSAGYRLWFASGKGIVRARMYRSFASMWEGWKKNIYPLMGGTPGAFHDELRDVIPWIPLVILLLAVKLPIAAFLAILLLAFRQIAYGLDLLHNQFKGSYIIYYAPALVLYLCVLCASYRAHQRGRVVWKGREYPVAATGTSR
jgi:cellulose synthase/poly-beta-1,6-N-acetylglucosamine synthase-like glycosyltransferase